MQPVLEIEAHFGNIVLILDEIYSEMHKFQFMGVRMETKTPVRGLNMLIQSISSNLNPIIAKLNEQREEMETAERALTMQNKAGQKKENN